LPSRYGCPLCGWRGWTFLPFVYTAYVRRGAICPNCRGLERHRAFALFLGRELARASAGKALEIGGAPGFRRVFREANWEYISLDIAPGKADIQGDVQDSPFGEGEFAAIVCFHVLEHVPDDRKALRELRRCVRPGGILFLAVPWYKDSLTQEFAAPDPLHHGHVRDYGRDIRDRIAEAGFEAEVVDCGKHLSARELRWWGIEGAVSRGNVFMCR